MNYQETPINNVAPFIAKRISSALQDGKRVLWLLSGGSGGHICIDAAEMLRDEDLTNLVVTMGDERYGQLGHDDENFQTLLDRGLELPGATLYRPLTQGTRHESAQLFSFWLKQTLEEVDHVIAITGIGSDGHTFGIKPRSSAVTSTDLVADFTWDDFERITITPTFARTYIDEMVVQAYGHNKHAAIQKILENNGNQEDFPALIYNEMDNVTLFSDFHEEKEAH